MKNQWNKFLLLGVIAVLVSCSEEEKEPDPIIGAWVLDDVEYTNAPAGYQYNEGESSTLYGETEYAIRFFEDLTFERELDGIVLTNGGDVEDEGAYELTEDELILDPDDAIGLDTDFDVVEPITERDMILKTTATFSSISDAELDAALDTITTQAEYQAIVDEYGVQITLDVTLYFDKE
ncbi:hypothetical protein BFP72_08555 [Reichenbachiella sp. 5M10]|uniref:hypothetical protein n=1 Tax=Reichenbachiella sp. 5M10 TaxID=1889772 RepID=UPI000C14790F|nr:hypothetical protein [Reichenbachiella sp. 5M10]PIB35442.1 hypothetical protein BFP72_08555 [Reichenbachiella sp. 5M10]